MYSNSLERYTFYSLLTLIIWLPIPLGSNRVWAWSIMEIWVAIQSICLITAYRGNLPLNYLNKYKVLLFSLSAFQIWVFLQTLDLPIELLKLVSQKSADIYLSASASYGSISLDPSMTKISLLKGLSYTLLIVNATFLINSCSRLRNLVIALVISATLQAFYASSIVLLNFSESLVFNYPEQHIATGSFVYKNHLANFLMLVLCLGFGLIVSELHVSQSQSWQTQVRRLLESVLSRKMFIRLCLVIMVIALVMTRSRMGNIAFFAALTIGSFLALVFYKQKPRAFLVLVASIITVETIIVGAIFGIHKVKQRLVETSFSEETRDQVIVWSLDIIRDFPITGTGMSSFYSIFPMYSRSDVGFYDHAHNDYVQFMVEAGIPATLLLAGLVVYSLIRALNTIRRRNSKTMKGIALGSIMSIIGMMIHITVDFNLQPAANAVTFLIILFLANATAILPTTGKLCSSKHSDSQIKLQDGEKC